MKFLITPNSDKMSQAIITDDYSPVEVANNVHIKNIKEDLKEVKFGSPVRLYAIVNDKPPTSYILLS